MVKLSPLAIRGAWLYESSVIYDSRGYLTEWFKKDLDATEKIPNIEIRQANLSNSKKGVVRGIHFSIAKSGQSKWITCMTGKIWDVIVDVRPDSPTFKKWTAIELCEASGKSVYMEEGLGHAFLALEENTTIAYLLTSPYSQHEEFVINITWPINELIFSAKDQSAPFLEEMEHILNSRFVAS